jgi:hypothetical protein
MQAVEQAMLTASLAPGTVPSNHKVRANPASGNSRISAALHADRRDGSVLNDRHARDNRAAGCRE